MISLSDFFQVLGENCVCPPDCVHVPVLITGFVAAQNKVCASARIECEQNAEGPASMLNPKFFHVCEGGSSERINVGSSESWTVSLKHSDASGHAAPLI
jgi:hypothetical protein